MTYIQTTREGVVVSIRLTPGASRDRIEGPDTRQGSGGALNVKVRARPEAGAANRALIALLAEQLGLRKSAFEVISGHASRQKRVLIRGNPAAIVPALRDLTA
jgi:uncharacterized protein